MSCEFIKNKMIFYLVLFGCIHLIHATELCFCGCECPTPRYTNCSYSFFSDIPQVTIDTLVLNLEFNEISILENYIFFYNNVLQVQSLNLANNEIRRIEIYAFSDMENLERLDLSGNKLTNMEPETFANTSKLSWLNLADNKMLILPEKGHFLNAQNLKTLYLSNTNINTIYTSTFQCMPNLESIYLDKNYLQKLDFNVFNNMLQNSKCANGSPSLTHLRNLKLTGNQWQCDCELQKVVLSYGLLENEDALLCKVSNETWRTVNELMCYDSIADSKKTPFSFSSQEVYPEDCESRYKSVFVIGIIIGVLSASSTFIIVAVLVHFARKCWDRVFHRTMEREGYEALE